MAARRRIGVTGNARRCSPSWLCSRLALALVGASAVRISLRHDPGEEALDGLIIGGGDDVSPEHYGHDIQARVRPDPARDRLEIDWIHRALADGLPLLGICRGAQLINVVLGGTLHQDIRPIRFHTYNRPGLLPTKQVLLEADCRLASVLRHTRIRVNSLHNQAIAQEAPTLRITGRDLDGIVQSVEAVDSRDIIGVQWHPEYLFYLPGQLRLFRWLANR